MKGFVNFLVGIGPFGVFLVALIDGVVAYEWKTNKKRQVSVYPATATATA